MPFIKEQGHTDKPFIELDDIRTAVELIIKTTIESAIETATEPAR